MTTVQRVWVAPYQRTLKTPLAWGSGHVMPTLDHVLVAVELSDGALGIAEANPRPTIYGETPESVEAVIRREIAPQLIGQPITSPTDIAAATARYALLKGNNSARAAVDIALWGALAQSQGATLATLLGATQPRVRVSYILGTGTPEQVLTEAVEVYAAGVRVLKVKVGKDLAQEQALIAALKAQFADLDLYIDANECYSPAQASEYLTAFATLDVLYCEEPLPVRMLNERAALRQSAHVPLIADDSCFTLADLQRELTFDTFDILNIKPPRNGFTESFAMLRHAQDAGKGVMLGSQASSLLGSLHTLILAGVEGVNHPSEGTFWLKIQDEPALTLTNGNADLDELNAALNGITPALTRRLYAADDTPLYWNSPHQAAIIEHRADQKLGEMFAMFTHSLRVHLNGVIGYTQLASRMLKTSPLNEAQLVEIAQDIDTVHKSGKYILDLISKTLNYSQLQAGRLNISLNPVEPHKILTETEQTYAKTSRVFPAMLIQVPPAAPLPSVLADEHWLTQILITLIDNGANAYTSTAPQRRVQLSAAEHMGGVIFMVQDWGQGIPPAMQVQIQALELWYGSSLLFAYRLMDVLGGQIWFETVPKAGTTFCLWFPFATSR